MWPFRKRKAPKQSVRDERNWNEDWQVGDIAECVVDFDAFHESVEPWHRPKLGQQFVVTGFSDATAAVGDVRAYFLKLEGWPVELETIAFRKLRSVTVENSEVVKRILNAKPGKDRVREG